MAQKGGAGKINMSIQGPALDDFIPDEADSWWHENQQPRTRNSTAESSH